MFYYHVGLIINENFLLQFKEITSGKKCTSLVSFEIALSSSFRKQTTVPNTEPDTGSTQTDSQYTRTYRNIGGFILYRDSRWP
jgi:hypothetical protein